MQKILYVFGGEKASGAEIVIDRLMRKNLHYVEAHLFIAPGAFANKLISEAPYIITTSSYLKKLNRTNTGAFIFLFRALKSYLFLSVKVLKYIKKNKITTIHANTVVPASYIVPALVIAKILYPKVVWLWSDHDLHYSSTKDNWFSSLNLKFYNATLAVSEAVKAKYKETSHYNKVIVLYNGLDIEVFNIDHKRRVDFRKGNNVPDDTILIGIAGILSERKGQKSLLNVFLQLTKQFNNLFLILAGNTTQEDKIYGQDVMDVTKENPYTTKYLGSVSDMVSFYNGCDIVVSNSNKAGSEPLGTTIYEAMACEKIVIASDTGGTKEIIDHKVTGFIFNVENNDELTETLKYCIANIYTLNNVKTAARSKVINNFDVQRMLSSYNSLLIALSNPSN